MDAIKYNLPTSAWQAAPEEVRVKNHQLPLSILRSNLDTLGSDQTLINTTGLPNTADVPRFGSTPTTNKSNFELPTIYKYLSVPSAAICAYHGYKRNDSVFWAFMWSMFGSVAPVFAPAIAFAQGIGDKKVKK